MVIITIEPMNARITKRIVDSCKARNKPYFVWDSELKGFGLSVSPNGAKSFVAKYRVGRGRSAPTRRTVVAPVGRVTPDEARTLARKIISKAALGGDPVSEKKEKDKAITIAALAELFLDSHVKTKRSKGTVSSYKVTLNKHIIPAFGKRKARELARNDVARWHLERSETPIAANRALAVIGSMYTFAQRHGYVDENHNPARRIEKFNEKSKERYLTREELSAVGAALRLAQTKGLPWQLDEKKPKSKHLPKPVNRKTILDKYAVAAIRLLIFTGARLREILHLKWENVDFERSMLFLPDSKTGKKTIVLNPPALVLLQSLPRVKDCAFVIAGQELKQPKADLKRPWALVSAHAGLSDVRIHDLRHTYASFGAGAGLGLPIVGKLLGHTQSATTQKYAHLDNDPVQRGANIIGKEIAAAMNQKSSGKVVAFNKCKRV